MDGGTEGDQDRPTPVRSVRVAGLDAVESTVRPEARVAGFDALDATPAASAQVVDFADLIAKRRARRDARSASRSGAPDIGPPATSSPATASPATTSATASPATARHAGVADGSATAPAGAAPAPRRRGERRAPGTTSSTAPVSSTAPAPSSDGPPAPDRLPTPDSSLPLDGPLPPGRRRGARVGRLGPDGPDPDRPELEADPVVVAREICLRLLTDRARTRQELAQALARKGVPTDAAAAVLDRFDEVGLIDDAAFAGQWVRSRHTHRGLGRRAIAVELRRKGVADDVAGEALAEVDAESEARRARELVERKLRALPVGTAEQRASAARRLVGMLARKGYGAGVAYTVVREALADHGAEADELGADGVVDD